MLKLVFLVLAFVQVKLDTEFVKNVGRFAEELERFVNSTIAKDFMEKYFRDLSLSEPESITSELLNKTVESIAIQVNEQADYLRKQQKFFNLAEVGPRLPQLCCGYNTSLKWVSKYRREVNINDICDQVGEYSALCDNNADNSRTTIDSYKKEEFLKRFKESNTKVYLGTRGGLFTKYPATNNLLNEKGEPKTQCECQAYDPRFRPWYIDTVNLGKGRDIFIMLEYSQHMKNIIQKFRSVVETLLKILFAKDRVYLRIYNVVVSECSSDFVQATVANVENLLSYVKETQVTSDTQVDFEDVFKDAFNALLRDNNGREKLFVFLTSGNFRRDNVAQVKDAIKPHIDRGNKNVKVEIIHLRESSNEDRNKDIIDIWESTTQNSLLKGVEQIDKTTNGDQIRDQIYNLFHGTYSTKNQDKIHFALPYNDFTGMGETLDTCIRIFTSTNELNGVLCMSSTFKEFLGDVVSENVENHYGFLIYNIDEADSKNDSMNKEGSTVYYHPNVEVEDKEIALNILNVETSKEFAQILQEIKNGTVQNVAGTTVSIGGKIKTYYWKQIPNIDFTLFVVSGNSLQIEEISLSRIPRSFPGNGLYHRLDFISNVKSKRDELSLCKFNGNVLTKEYNTYKISSSSFAKKFYHFDEGKPQVDSINEYFQAYNRNVAEPSQFKTKDILTDLRGSIIAADHISSVWKNDTSQYSIYAVFRYLAFTNGLITSLPGLRLHPYYDPRSRPWFIRSMQIPDKMFITPPYIDAFTGQVTLSIHQAFYKYAGVIAQPTGVWGVDLSLEYFQFLLLKYTDIQCRDVKSLYSCIIVDSEGNLIYDKRFTDNGNITFQRDINIIKMEPILGEKLIEDGVMKKQSCIGYNKVIRKQQNRIPFTQFTYSISNVKSTLNGETAGVVEYVITPLREFASYAIKYIIKGQKSTICQCEKKPLRFPYPELVNETCGPRDGSNKCECPCYLFENCNENQPKTSVEGSSVDVCSPKIFEDERLSFNTKWNVDMFTPPLSECLDFKCEIEKSFDACKRPGCEWDEGICKNKALSNPTTTARTTTTNKKDGVSDSDDDDKMIAVYVIIPIVLISIIAFICYMNRDLIKSKLLYNHNEKNESSRKEKKPNKKKLSMGQYVVDDLGESNHEKKVHKNSNDIVL